MNLHATTVAIVLLTMGLAAVVVYVLAETRDLERLRDRIEERLERLVVFEEELERAAIRAELEDSTTGPHSPSERLRRLRGGKATPEELDEP